MSEHAREPDEAMVKRFAKQVAEIRQHGCHYAEGTCIECHKIARAALAAIGPGRTDRDAWQPIETAPRIDDRAHKLLLWWPHWCTDRPVIGYWTRWHGGWRADEALSADGVPPTHWMLLPSSPEKPPAPTPPAAERATQAASDLHQRAKDCVDAIEVACGVFFGVETAEWRDACLILTTEFIAISDSARQEAAQEVADWEARFELFWAAQQRGVDAWRAAHPGSGLTLPDMAHMTTWLLEERERQYRWGFADAKAVYGSA